MEYAERQDVLGLALDLHMATTGSMDLQWEHMDHAIAHLEVRLSNWSTFATRTAVFDEAVRMLLTVALAEAKEYRRNWRNANKEPNA